MLPTPQDGQNWTQAPVLSFPGRGTQANYSTAEPQGPDWKNRDYLIRIVRNGSIAHVQLACCLAHSRQPVNNEGSWKAFSSDVCAKAEEGDGSGRDRKAMGFISHYQERGCMVRIETHINKTE